MTLIQENFLIVYAKQDQNLFIVDFAMPNKVM